MKEGVTAAGMVGLRFNTIGVSDGISMGTDGMSYSLQSRDLIADSIETVMAAQWYDANVSIPGCDKNMPGCLIAMGRLNRPSLMVYGGTIRAGHHERPEAGHHLRLPELRPIHHPHDHRGAAPGNRPSLLSRSRRVRRDVYREYHGLRHRDAGHEPALQLIDAGGRSLEARRMFSRRRRHPAICSSSI